MASGEDRLGWSKIVRAAEKLRGQPWQEMLEVRGEWGRDRMHVAVRYGGYRLVEVVRAIEGMEYQAAAQAVRRFQARMKTGKEERAFVEQMKRPGNEIVDPEIWLTRNPTSPIPS